MKEKLRALNPTAVLIMLLIVSAALRFFDLGAESLWNDELSSWMQSKVQSVNEVVANAIDDVHPPGYQVFIYYFMRQFGDSEAVLRLPSAVAGVLATLLTYLLGKMLYSRSAGLTAAAIITVSWNPILYAQEARSYSILLTITLACSYFWVELVTSLYEQRRARNIVILGYIASAVIACYVHYFGLLFVALQGIFGALILYKRPRAFFYLSSIYIAVLVFYSPWIPSMLDQMSRHREFWIPEPVFLDMLLSQFQFAYKVPSWFLLLFVVPAYVYFLVRMAGYSIRKVRDSVTPQAIAADVFLLMWVAAPFVAAFIQSKVSTPVMTSRNLIILLPPLYIILSGVLWRLPWKPVGTVWALIVVVGITSSTLHSFGYYDSIKKQQFREAAGFVLENDEGIPVIAWVFHKQYFEYYFERMGSTRKIDMIAGDPEDLPSLQAFLAGGDEREFWYMTGHRNTDPEFLARVEEKYRLVDIKEFKGASVRRYQLF